jgi:hypothetical protein
MIDLLSPNGTEPRLPRQEQNLAGYRAVGILVGVTVKSRRKAVRKPSFKLAREDVEPRGDNEALQAALACLGPFTGGKVGKSAAEDREFAELQIYEISRFYNWERLLQAEFPRSKVVKDSLDEIIRGTAAAFRAIERMDDFTRFMFEACAHNPNFSELYDTSDAQGLPLSSYRSQSDRDSPWLVKLNALHQLATAQKSVFEEIVGDDDGGRSNLFTDLHISAEYQLVERGWAVFDLFKPDQAKGTLNNPFVTFLQSIYEYATGKGASEEGAPALLNKIKPMIAHLRERKRILEETDATEKQLNAVLEGWVKDGIHPLPLGVTQQIDQLEAQASAVARHLRQSVSKKPRR